MLRDLGNVSATRVRLHPVPGTATERDLIRIHSKEESLCELVDGVLIEKILSAPESCLTADLAFRLGLYLDAHDLGFLTMPDGPTRLARGIVRLPDISFVSWARMPTKHYPATFIADVVPNLAVEVLSEGNTRSEMRRKRREYFSAGVELVWEVDPFRRIVDVYTDPEHFTTLTERDTLDGGTVLPGFALPLRELFARLPRDLKRRAGKQRKTK
jgi:Uma2 family endonuclease